MISCNKFNSKEDAFKFEKEINEIIINKIKEKDLINKFKQINDNCMNLDYLSNKSIIEELFPYDKYPEKDFPDFKYFYISELPSQEHFIQKFNSKDRNKEYYPIINSIINNGAIYSKIELMKYLPKINKLCNYMLNFVSFKYSRDDAKSLIIKDVIKDEEILSLLKEFIPIYKKIRPYIKQEGCHEFGELYLEMKEDSVLLSDLCVDSGEMGFGLVLLATYKEMSGWQNNFINSIINSENIQLKNYKDLFNSKIMIQDCENDQILDLPHFDTKIILRNGTNATLFDMILDNSYRKESEVIYNYEEIEEELAAFILPKIKAFKQDFRKVIYQYECFVGERSSMIIDFNDKYQIRELTEIELNSIVCYILKKNNKLDTKNFLFSLQVLIAIILDESPYMNETLYSIIEKKNNKDIPFIDITINFFKGVLDNIKQFEEIEKDAKNNYNNYLTVNCLINLFEIVELFCWDNIRKNLDKKYFENISEEIKVQFNSALNLKQEEKNNVNLITKLELCSAIRKFISRYCAGKSEENIKVDQLLKSYLVNGELWPISFDNDEIDIEINKIFGNNEIKISQAVNLYDYLGGDAQKLEEIKEKFMKYSEKYLQLKNNMKEEKINDTKKSKTQLDNNSKEIIKIRKSINTKNLKDEIVDNNNEGEENKNILEENNIEEMEEEEIEEEEEEEEEKKEEEISKEIDY